MKTHTKMEKYIFVFTKVIGPLSGGLSVPTKNQNIKCANITP